MLASPAAAYEPIAAYDLTFFWFGNGNENGNVFVEFGQDVTQAKFTIDVLPVGQVSRRTGIDLTSLRDEGHTDIKFWLSGVGFYGSGFFGASSKIPVTPAQLRASTLAELEFSRWDETSEYAGELPIPRTDFEFELRFYVAPEPSSALLALGALGVCLAHRRRLS